MKKTMAETHSADAGQMSSYRNKEVQRQVSENQTRGTMSHNTSAAYNFPLPLPLTTRLAMYSQKCGHRIILLTRDCMAPSHFFF